MPRPAAIRRRDFLRLPAALGLAPAFPAAGATTDQPARDVNPRTAAGSRILFLDLETVEARENVVQRVLEATKHVSNPVLPLGDVTEWDALQARPWESRTVLYDQEERLFKCWYAGKDLSTERWWATGYATSEDGVIWVKPRLGLHEYGGNKNNNICMYAWGPVIKDPAEADENKRYKMIVKGPPRERGIRVAYSRNGTVWKEGASIDVPEWGGLQPDIVVLVRDDQDPDPRRRFKLVWQLTVPARKPGPDKVRAKGLAYGPDVEHFTASKANPILEPGGGLEQENHFLMLFPYRGQYVMLYEYGWYLPNGTGNFGSYCADIRLAVSRDGEHFKRIQPDQKVIGRGRRGEWDGGFLVISDKPVIKDDTIYLYYAGNGEDWTSWPGGNIPPGYRFASTGSVRLSRMGLATLEVDRFTCLETTDRETPGSVTTVPMSMASGDARVVVNMSDAQPQRSWIEVEVLDGDRRAPVPGLTAADGLPLSRNGSSVPVAWRDTRLADLGASLFRLRVRLYGAARLHGFGFERAGA
jgi:hypothetical protein